MEKNINVTSRQTVFRLLFLLILISNFSIISFGQSFPLQEKEVAIPEQAMEQVVKRVLIWTFKPRTKPTTIYLAEQRIKKSWLPTIKNIEFQLLSADEIQQKNLAVYFFTNSYLSANTFNIILMFGTVSCDYLEHSYPWRFRIIEQKVKLWSSERGFGGGCGDAFLDAAQAKRSIDYAKISVKKYPFRDFFQMKNFCFAIIISILIFHTSCNFYSYENLCSRTSTTETEAKEIAKKRLQTFCERKGIDIAKFSEPKISQTKDVPWVLDYTANKSDKDPNYFFRVIINNCGMVETSYEEY